MTLYELFNLIESTAVVGPVFRTFKYLLPRHRKLWDLRVQDALLCPDNALIPRVPNAGRIIDGTIIMHNGLKTVAKGYYGRGIQKLLQENRGVHEPQEERMFMEVLKYMPAGAIMLELGSYWAFYSMWFLQEARNGRCFLVEPSSSNLNIGRKNFQLNGMSGTFIKAYVGSRASTKNQKRNISLSVDEIVKTHLLRHVNILHSDIQGNEMKMLIGAGATIARRMIDYIFISTHSDDLHRECISFLAERNYRVLAEADLESSYSYDGLIVARRKELAGLEAVQISKKTSLAR